MANTWLKGHFGLESFDSIGTFFNTLTQTFNDNLSGNYIDVNDVLNPSYTLTPLSDGKVDEPSYTVIPQLDGKVDEPNYTLVPSSTLGKVSEPTYTLVPSSDGKVDEPVYTDKGISV